MESGAPHPGLLDLPAELLEWIAGYVPLSDLLSMRLVSRDVSAKSIKIVAQRHFRDRAFFIRSGKSVQALGRISCHPVFGKSMRHIRLSAACLVDPREDIRRRNVALPSQTREARSSRRAFRATYEALRKHERVFHDKAHLFLADVLRRFQAAQNCPAIHATDSYVTSAWGQRLIGRLVGYDQPFVDTLDDWIYRTIRSAIRQAKYSIKSLHLGFQANPVPFEVFKDCWNELCWKDLTTLHVTLLPDTRKRDEQGRSLMISDEYSNQMVSFLAMLVAASNLEDLSLAFESHLAFTPDRCIMNCLAVHWENLNVLPRLRSLRLRGFMIDPQLLLRFLEGRKSTIREVDFFNIKDNVRDHPDMEQRVIETLNDGVGTEKKVSISGCWDGWRWLEDYLGLPINEEFVREVFGLDTGLNPAATQV